LVRCGGVWRNCVKSSTMHVCSAVGDWRELVVGNFPILAKQLAAGSHFPRIYVIRAVCRYLYFVCCFRQLSRVFSLWHRHLHTERRYGSAPRGFHPTARAHASPRHAHQHIRARRDGAPPHRLRSRRECRGYARGVPSRRRVGGPHARLRRHLDPRHPDGP
jgi:hypothetical protein